MFSFELFRDLVPRAGVCDGDGFWLRRGGVGGTSPMSSTRKSILLHSIFSAATGVRAKISMFSGRIPSSGRGDVIGGTIPGSVDGSGAAGRHGAVTSSDISCAARVSSSIFFGLAIDAAAGSVVVAVVGTFWRSWKTPAKGAMLPVE